MPSRVRPIDDAARRMKRQLDEVLSDIREARIAGGLSQAALARTIGLSPMTISRIERGATPIERPTASSGCNTRTLVPSLCRLITWRSKRRLEQRSSDDHLAG